MWLSHEVHGYPRLGEAGEQLALMEGVETIDVSAVGTQRISGHLYHLFNPAVTADLERLLHSGDSARERPGLEAAQLDGKPYWRMLPVDSKEYPFFFASPQRSFDRLPPIELGGFSATAKVPL